MTVDKAVSGQLGRPNDEILTTLKSEVPDSTKLPSKSCPCIKWAVALAAEGVVEDYKKNYEKALWLYQQSEKYFLHTIEKDAKSEHTKDGLRQKLKQYQDRALIIQSLMNKRRVEKNVIYNMV